MEEQSALDFVMKGEDLWRMIERNLDRPLKVVKSNLNQDSDSSLDAAEKVALIRDDVFGDYPSNNSPQNLSGDLPDLL